MKIKFRAWDTEKGKYFEPTYEAYVGKLEELLIMQSGDLILRKMDGVYHESMFTGRFVIEQFTGLLDKNGKEIYEGDIVTSGMLNNHDWIPCNAVITYDSSWGSFVARLVDQTIGDEQLLDVPCEVVGNIHDGGKCE